MAKLLQFSEVSKTLSGQKIINQLSFAVEPGEIVVLLGPNGAGKSTTMLLSTGLITPDSGKIEICGHDLNQAVARFHVSYCPQDPQFPANMCVQEIFKLVAAHFSKRCDEVIEVFGLSAIWNKKVHILSGGQRRALALALAFCGGSDVVVLDEPTVGLDTEVRRRVWDYCRTRAATQTQAILMSTHYLDEAESLASRIMLLKQGVIVRSGSARDIHQEFGFTRIQFILPDEAARKIPFLKTLHQNRHYLDTQNTKKTLQTLMLLPGFEIESIKPVPLEEVLKNLQGNQTQ